MEFWLVSGLVAISIISERWLPLAVGCAGVFAMLRWLAVGRPIVRTPLDLPVALLIVMLPVTLWATSLPETTIVQVLRLLTGIGLYYALVNWLVSPARLRLVLLGLALSAAGLSVFALFSVEWAFGKLPIIPDALYAFLPTLIPGVVHRNVMAGTLVILALPIVSWLLFAWGDLRHWERLLFGGAGLMAVSILILTQSRGGLLALGLALMVLIGLRWRWGWAAAALIALLGGGAVWMAGKLGLIESLFYADIAGGALGRLEIWQRAIDMIRDFPFTGVGLGAFGPVADRLYPFFIIEPRTTPHAHNLFLQIAVDLGLPGLIAWLAAWLLVLAAAWKVYTLGRARPDRWIMGLGAGFLGSQIALAVHGLLDAVAWGMVRPAPVVWALWGLTVAAWSVFRGSKDAQPLSGV
jgi:putative inorganic carbon (HCO3(-)) transporter